MFQSGAYTNLECYRHIVVSCSEPTSNLYRSQQPKHKPSIELNADTWLVILRV